jgi:hypothetical protein
VDISLPPFPPIHMYENPLCVPTFLILELQSVVMILTEQVACMAVGLKIFVLRSANMGPAAL